MSVPKDLNNIDQAVFGLIIESFFKYKQLNPTGVWLEDFHLVNINYREAVESLVRLKGRDLITDFKFGYGGISLDVGGYIVSEEDTEDMENWALFQIHVNKDSMKKNEFKPSRIISIGTDGKLYVGGNSSEFLEKDSGRLKMFIRLARQSGKNNKFVPTKELEEIGGKSTSKQVAKELGEVGNNLALKIYDNNKISLIEGKKGSGYRLLLEVSIRE
ncbi:hypothetical protein COU49_02515 [Candidatus Nomurabacteria bacterium CG10_big_fil_rev_8_21_14_0_10_35_16]|uniref:Uncharacterized protein n=1 Tax=Candidatus Nomurabacteria bacterium CG10_big_fil_rev_8_21_14_0_10_35_16 TaxID=1974731 RepID=A0A2H0TD56_9BACT|nr:MAG: hypothetical protein COU49_02515 [Candidatus Nomurabacteria bacterium CG10_big_fil_rev_8_21_14_0_10_35_16]